MAGLDEDATIVKIDEEIASGAKIKIAELAETFDTQADQMDACNHVDDTLSDLEQVMYAAAVQQRNLPTDQLASELVVFETLCNQTSLTGVSFWKQFGGKMPLLNRIYRHVKSIMPSNASIERMFSDSTLLLSDLRQSMMEATLEAHLLLNHKC